MLKTLGYVQHWWDSTIMRISLSWITHHVSGLSSPVRIISHQIFLRSAQIPPNEMATSETWSVRVLKMTRRQVWDEGFLGVPWPKLESSLGEMQAQLKFCTMHSNFHQRY